MIKLTGIWRSTEGQSFLGPRQLLLSLYFLYLLERRVSFGETCCVSFTLEYYLKRRKVSYARKLNELLENLLQEGKAFWRLTLFLSLEKKWKEI